MLRRGATVLVAGALIGIGGTTWAAGKTQVGGPADANARIRSDAPEVRQLIAEGVRRSATFRRLLETIAQTDGVVYVLEQSCGPRSVRACLSMAMTIAGRDRILFVRLVPGFPDDETIASLGHELQHVVEVISDPTVRSGAEMYFLFKRIASWLNHESFETRAAERVGDAILAELRRARGQ